MSEKHPRQILAETPTSGSWTKSREQILVIADSDAMRERLASVLSRDGFVIFEQPSAIGATRSIRDNSIRAVVIDLGVPGIRGDKLISLLRENRRLEGLVIVVVAGESGCQALDTNGLESANAILDRSSVESRLSPVLARLLRGSNYRPTAAFSTAAGKS